MRWRRERNLIAMLTPVRRRLAAVSTVLLVPVLGACNYQTDQVYQPAVGVNNRAGSVDVLGAVVVSSSAGRGTLVASLVNNDTETDDSLTGVTGTGVEASLVTPVSIAADSLVNLADSGAVGVTGDTVEPGGFVRLTLSFRTGEDVKVNVPVVPASGEYADITSPSLAPTS